MIWWGDVLIGKRSGEKSSCTLLFYHYFDGNKILTHLPLLDLARIWPTIIVGDTGNRVPRLAQTLAAAAGVLEFAATPQGIDLRFADQRTLVNVYRKGEVTHIYTAQRATQIIAVDLLAHAGEVHAEGGCLTAHVPGKLVSFAVRAGDSVKKGQALAVMDAMKLEHTITPPRRRGDRAALRAG
ncbi:MAG: 3-methylcrotonoyl-CoA carboxylase subunit alpha [Comamonadaceae bacterium]|nr:MAG: 3-methylcrotonoyl-CoA carboxylase subunit alpha [Comamonadaceae bacterium]